MMAQTFEYLPMNREEMQARGWNYVDFVLVSGDAYVDHPSFGSAIIGRVLEAAGYKVGMLAQPEWHTSASFTTFGCPRLAFLISGGVVDSMVSHYSVAKIRRKTDAYTPGGRMDKRPDRCDTVYAKLARQAYPEAPIVMGGLEASLRRFAHYDYWQDTVLPSILESSGADMVLFGMGERPIRELADRLAAGEPLAEIRDLAGSCYLTDFEHLPAKYVECAGYKKVAQDKTAYARATRIQMDEQDPVSGVAVVQRQSESYLVQNPPAKP
ncbi:MAG: YgiQ family radical SAM protein, partial [Gemmiger sp.]|nr:YgiQ family radical SAM protein [Gemmiger sp.]